MYPYDQPLSPFSDQNQTPEQQWLADQEIGVPAQQPLVSQQPRPAQTSNRIGNLGFTALDALGFANQATQNVDRKAERRRLQQLNSTDAQDPVDPRNPFGNYTLNAGIGNNFQPTQHTPTQRWGFASGGEAGPPNKTQQYLQQITPGQAGQQEFWGQAINDIDHPLQAGQKVSYQQLQQLVQGPQRKQILDQYAKQQKLASQPSAELYLQDQFTQGQNRLYDRAQQVPDHYAFPEQADQARQNVLRPLELRGANQVQPTRPGEMSNAQMRAQYYSQLQHTTSYVAPGVAQKQFHQGGEYQLTDYQIEELRAQGYQIEER